MQMITQSATILPNRRTKAVTTNEKIISTWNLTSMTNYHLYMLQSMDGKITLRSAYFHNLELYGTAGVFCYINKAHKLLQTKKQVE